MNERQQRTLAAYRRIVSVLSRFVSRLAPEALVILERLRATIDEIDRQEAKQTLARTNRPLAPARRLVEAMRKEKMLPLARLARRLFAGEPAIAAALRVPHKRAPADELFAASALMVRTLRPHRALLAQSRIDPKRIDQLQLEARRLKKLLSTLEASLADRAVPTRRLTALFASAQMDVAALDALVGASSTGITAWHSIRRIGKRIGRPRSRPRKPQ
jgi:hypothetical protein